MNELKQMLYMCRHLIAGRSQVVPCEIRRLGPGDIDEVLRLHHRVTRGLSHEIYVPTGDEDLWRLVNGEGISLGVWFEDRLICMRAVVTDADWVGEILAEMGFTPEPEHKTAYTDHCIVDRDFRGNNVQFLTHYAIENEIAAGYGTFYTTVSPKNSFSMQNILGCNFVAVGLKKLYGGYMRFIMRKDLAHNMPLWTHGHLIIPISDAGRQLAALSEGYVGYKLIRKHRGFSVLYAPMADNPPKGYWRNMAT